MATYRSPYLMIELEQNNDMIVDTRDMLWEVAKY